MQEDRFGVSKGRQGDVRLNWGYEVHSGALSWGFDRSLLGAPAPVPA